MMMPGRKYSATNGYRYGFNGKENDNEAKGSGNQQDYGMRIYDPRVGKFFSEDPITHQYPSLTPYQFASNRPIDGIDLDGLEWWKKALWLVSPVMGTSTDKEISKGIYKRAKKTAIELYEGLKNLKNIPAPTTTIADPRPKTVMNEQLAKAVVENLKQTWEEYKELASKACNGDKEAMGRMIFEGAMFIIPGLDELIGLKATTKIFNGVSTKVLSKSVRNSGNEIVERFFVQSEDDLLRVAEDAAGGSLDNFVEIKPNFFEGSLNGKKLKIEWQPGGEKVMNEGPHVKIEVWDPLGGKKGTGAWKVEEKYFLFDESQQQKLYDELIKKTKVNGTK